MTPGELLQRRRKVLLKQCETIYGPEKLYSVVVDPKHVSPDGLYIELGQYYGDSLFGWHPVKMVAEHVESVLDEFEDDPEPAPIIPQSESRRGFFDYWLNK